MIKSSSLLFKSNEPNGSPDSFQNGGLRNEMLLCVARSSALSLYFRWQN